MPPCIVDSNVVLPLLLEQHPHRAVAATWWNDCADESVLFTLPVRMGVLRLLTNRALMGDGVLTPESAWQIVSTLLTDARAVTNHDPPLGLDIIWLRLVRGREPSPNLWTDAWLAAYAEAANAEMVTLDRGFRSFNLKYLRLLQA